MSKKKKTNTGGNRPGAGRKPIDPTKRKQTILLYVEAGTIDILGGKESLQNLCYSAIENILTQKTHIAIDAGLQ